LSEENLTAKTKEVAQTIEDGIIPGEKYANLQKDLADNNDRIADS